MRSASSRCAFTSALTRSIRHWFGKLQLDQQSRVVLLAGMSGIPMMAHRFQEAHISHQAKSNSQTSADLSYTWSHSRHRLVAPSRYLVRQLLQIHFHGEFLRSVTAGMVLIVQGNGFLMRRFRAMDVFLTLRRRCGYE